MQDDQASDKKSINRRVLFGQMAAAAVALPLAAQAQTAQQAAPLANPKARTPGGSGPIKVLFITAYHPFDRENLYSALDALGEYITWTHVEHPAAEALYDPEASAKFDVFLFYDAFAGRETKPGTKETYYAPPSAKTQANFKKLLQNGDKGFVFFHHALASWIHSWPAGVNGSNAYAEVMGGAADWSTPIKNIRGKDYPTSGFRQGTEQRLTVIDKTHPIVQGLGDGFDVVDEPYVCPMFEDSVHCLMRTSWKADPNADSFKHGAGGFRVGAGHPAGSNMAVWVKAAETSPVAYIQPGHDNVTWSNANWRLLMLNAIKWAASPEAKAWAHANPARIFV